MEDVHSSHRTTVNMIHNTTTTSQEESQSNSKLIVKTYLEEIDRLNVIVGELQEEVSTFKLKLTSMINQEQRIE